MEKTGEVTGGGPGSMPDYQEGESNCYIKLTKIILSPVGKLVANNRLIRFFCRKAVISCVTVGRIL